MVLLKLKNIGKIYNNNDLLVIGIRNINLDFQYNEFVTIEGESGSGKSTLLNVIGANDTYEEGELYFNDEETTHYSEKDWQEYRENNISTIFQDFNIIENLTVLENVELALFRLDDKKERRKVAKELIEKVGLQKQINQKSSKLSGGEKQRTVIARALAKDSPIILADEPTGNLDVKSSNEISKLLKDISKDKLVIVVTHNPEFFEEHATRRIKISDGKVQEDKIIKNIDNQNLTAKRQNKEKTKKQEFKNIMQIGLLNYKSRPKFTIMMTFALIICSITLFLILSTLGEKVIKKQTTTLDDSVVNGKVIISSNKLNIDNNILDLLVNKTNANFSILDRENSEFNVHFIGDNIEDNYEITCLYDPIKHNLKQGEALLVIPYSKRKEKEKIKDFFIKADVGINNITVKTKLDSTKSYLYLSNYEISKNALKIKAINKNMRISDISTPVYSYRINEDLKDDEINLVNSTYYQVLGKTVIFDIKQEKAFKILNDNQKDEKIKSIIVEMSRNTYLKTFKTKDIVNQSSLYFKNDDLAKKSIKNLPEGYFGALSSTKLYVENVGDIFTKNIAYYMGLILISVLFGMLIIVIFIRSIKIYEQDFAIYKTLGISKKISSSSLYVEMALIFLPTLIFLPILSFILATIPTLNMVLISFKNYIFIELMILFIVQIVAFSFNRSITRKSINKSLKRGSK